MWIVIFGNKTRHSAWNSKQEAIQQAKVLEAVGYIRGNQGKDDLWLLSDFVIFDETVQCRNGHYYV